MYIIEYTYSYIIKRKYLIDCLFAWIEKAPEVIDQFE